MRIEHKEDSRLDEGDGTGQERAGEGRRGQERAGEGRRGQERAGEGRRGQERAGEGRRLRGGDFDFDGVGEAFAWSASLTEGDPPAPAVSLRLRPSRRLPLRPEVDCLCTIEPGVEPAGESQRSEGREGRSRGGGGGRNL
eukprot:767490-Hanusia_phi.AAC.2